MLTSKYSDSTILEQLSKGHQGFLHRSSFCVTGRYQWHTNTITSFFSYLISLLLLIGLFAFSRYQWNLFYINIFRPTQNGRHFPDDIFECIFLNEICKFQLIFHWSLFLRAQLTIFQHWFRLWLGTGQATSHCLNQWWLVYWRLYKTICVWTLGKWLLEMYSNICTLILRPLARRARFQFSSWPSYGYGHDPNLCKVHGRA